MLITLSDLSQVHGGKGSPQRISNMEQLMQRVLSDQKLVAAFDNPKLIKTFLNPDIINLCVENPSIIQLVADIDPAFLPEVASQMKNLQDQGVF